jgi:1,4-dihydroxy-2-naphthoate polyprenyltransferase
VFKKITLWLIALRVFSFVTTVVPVTLGVVIAYREGYFSPILYVLTLIGGVSLHGGTNLINDYYDYLNGVDEIDSHQSCGVIFNSTIKPIKIHNTGILLLVIGISIGFYLASIRGIEVALLGAIGAIGGYFYTAKPINFKYKGLGLPAVFILMGPMIVYGSYYVQTMKYNPIILWFSIPIGLLVAAILHSNDIRDIIQDSNSGINTFTVIIGRRKSVFIFYILIAASYLFILTMVMLKIYSPWLLLIFITMPQAIKLMSQVSFRHQTAQTEEYIVAYTAKFYGQFGAVLIAILLFI